MFVLTISALLNAQESPSPQPQRCLIVARYGTEGPFFYRDEYGVPVDHLQLAYNGDELAAVMKSGVKVVVYDVKEHESFAEARESCFLTPQASAVSK
jgi:hypothetical protein